MNEIKATEEREAALLKALRRSQEVADAGNHDRALGYLEAAVSMFLGVPVIAKRDVCELLIDRDDDTSEPMGEACDARR